MPRTFLWLAFVTLLREGDFSEATSIQLTINCKKQIGKEDVQIWGTIVDLTHEKQVWYAYDDQSFPLPVWLFTIGGIQANIDGDFSPTTHQIIERIINDLDKDFQAHYR
jgi:hypothetical protein